ncbi:hypothetical protein [Chryseobacterium sp. Leaf201]|uniref:hypothetical protein n=1 Tax=Chryseobacterium sp. Leaf201 TaxID=1735672 RepID=UPI0006FECB81|nr:hypothetical protein [Chryseobacterium sp. Leaf201]KQM23390.1 hypothetical protein ASE55_17885 [Chryseobacterium sp. Leaf201]
MNNFLTIITFIFLSAGNGQKKIIASYSAISCPCAQWKVESEKEKIYLERENEKIPDVDKLWDGKTLPFKVYLEGKFKSEKGVPKVFKNKGESKPAKIFVYNKLEVLK